MTTPISFSNPAGLWALLPFLPLLALPFLGHRSRSMQPPRRLLLVTALRLLIGLGIILSLAGLQWLRPVDNLTVVFVLDLSDSVPTAEKARAEAFIRQAISGIPQGNQAAIVAFGEQALVERLTSEVQDLPPIASVPGSGRTNIAAALRLALALFPEASQKRIVLFSDGLENTGDALAQTDLATARGVEIAVLPLLAPSAEREAYIGDMEIPSSMRQGQSFDMTVEAISTVTQQATLRLLHDGQLLNSRIVSLAIGTQRITFSLTASGAGFHRYQVELDPTLDTLPQNNLASGFTVVYGPPRVLIAAETQEEAATLVGALISTGIQATVVTPAHLPVEPAAVSGYDAVVLMDVPADALPDGTMEALPIAVRELGRGLVMIGGEHSYGAGGYLRTPLEAALPVDMDVRSRTREPNVALVLAIDRSGSMGRCHCNDPDARVGEYERVEVGLPKIDIAKDAIIMASEALGPLDYLGVVAFDENALWAHQLQQLVDRTALQNAIGSIQAEGQTNIFAGLAEAEAALVETEARVKHIILLTDGWSRTGDYDEFTERLAEEGITLSVVAAGTGSAAYLEGLAISGGGRYYPVPTIDDLPSIFLHETIQTVGSYIIEEPFYPLPAGTTPILRGLDPADLPPLWGYNGTTPKETAQTALLSPRGDPVLTQWQYGLGRAVAWTSDMKGQWAVDWVTWEKFNRFAAQLVGWTLPDSASERLQTSLSLDGADIRFRVNATDDKGRPSDLLDTEVRLIGPDLQPHSLKLEQTAAGLYEGSTRAGEPGTYLVHIVQRDITGEPVAQQTTGLVVPYSPEYRRTGGGDVLLEELTRTTGGAMLQNVPETVWAPMQAPVLRAQQLSPALLLAAILLFPVDVAMRRLQLAKADWQQLGMWLRARLPGQQHKAADSKQAISVLPDKLFEARERARRRGMRGTGTVANGEHDTIQNANQKPTRLPEQENTTAPKPPQLAPDEDTLARLRKARDRARRQR